MKGPLRGRGGGGGTPPRLPSNCGDCIGDGGWCCGRSMWTGIVSSGTGEIACAVGVGGPVGVGVVVTEEGVRLGEVLTGVDAPSSYSFGVASGLSPSTSKQS